MNTRQQEIQKALVSPPSFVWYMMRKLPSVIFWGIRISRLDLAQCHTRLPFNWRSTNPFRSIYFSAMAGAAELASGALCMLHITGKGSYSMLVTNFEATFHKKANQTVTMSCLDGKKIQETIAGLRYPGDTATVTVAVSSQLPNGESPASFAITWSFKRR
ncbi:PaaI family thioesterase [Cyclobacterium jeungdonense]|uniref:DUF4442 domain-containing protein n=1 Tax=Cyclobacterium jeungdonense TaxID=708087 RepID=A0ABT8C4W8_9BACT|nr:DUF4442 domain-containing protein [Cyclobacterium jeungdonense]MDN3687351.1 DUF4442 domain-containing protein [Cyclobacterium jeungdonense]